MKDFRIGLIVCFLIHGAAFGQAPGYMGKRNIISFFSTGNIRVFPAVGLPVFSDGGNGYHTYKYNELGTPSTGSKIARYDLHLAYGRVMSRRMIVGAEFSYELLNLPRSSVNSSESTPIFNVYGAYVTLGLGSSRAIAPLGFSSTFGIGPKFYRFDYSRNYVFAEGNQYAAFPDYKKQMCGFNLFYQLMIRKPLTNFMVLDFGMRIHTGFVFRNGIQLKNGSNSQEMKYTDGYTDYYIEPTHWTKNSLQSSLFTEVVSNILSFRLGVGFML